MTSSKWTELDQSMKSQNFLTRENPVITLLQSGALTPHQGTEVLKQYFHLVTTIVQFLISAMARIPVQAVKDELRRNLDEELGSRTGGKSHQEILERLLQAELGIDVRKCWNRPTEHFIVSLMNKFHFEAEHYVAGMIYALEATASTELVIVGHIINLSAQRQIVDTSRLRNQDAAPGQLEYNNLTLHDFLAMHTLDFEQGHESGLRETLRDFAEEDWQEFSSGFYQVLALMQLWWTKLARGY